MTLDEPYLFLLQIFAVSNCSAVCRRQFPILVFHIHRTNKESKTANQTKSLVLVHASLGDAMNVPRKFAPDLSL